MNPPDRAVRHKRPPHVALWLLRQLAADEILVGDLLEEYRAGRSSLWLWRQVFLSMVITTMRDGRRHPAQ
jgi:hypothetical protein